ncbi:MAG: hypothetical protein OXE02_07020, partial [Chloroflexi bacterium]|nr:hypothetical protein [Chloroflexota bacterium]
MNNVRANIPSAHRRIPAYAVLALLAAALVALAVFVAPGAQPAQAQSDPRAFPPYDARTPAKQVDITIVDDPLTVEL